MPGLQPTGRGSHRRGFTLIELLAIIMMIGVLASVTIPKFARAKDKAYRGVMMTDLRNLATAQERFFVDNQAYASDTTTLDAHPSGRVTITIRNATATGWRATAMHANSASKCEIFVGSQVPSGGKDGIPVCS